MRLSQRVLCSVLFALFTLATKNVLANGDSPSTLRATAQQLGDVPVIIKYKKSAIKSTTLSSTTSSQRKVLVSKIKKFSPKNIKTLDRFGITSMRVNAAGLDAILEDPNVESVYEDKVLSPSLLESTGLIGSSSPTAVATGANGQVIAVLDTGVESSHPFLDGKVIHEACFSTTSSNATTTCPNNQSQQYGTGAGAPCTFNGCAHGTHVAGIVAGSNTSYTGVAADSKIISIQVFSEFSAEYCGGTPCPRTYFSDVMRGLDYIYSLRNTYNIAAVNLSLGGGHYAQSCDSDYSYIKNPIDLLLSAGIATVAASGNDSYSDGIGTPACISSAISVGATTKQDAVAYYSNSSNLVDLLAPGSAIESSVTGGGYAYYSGTSMAAPHVAGAFAVLKSRFPNKSISELLSLLKSTGTNITDARNNLSIARVQIDDAINNALDYKEHDFNLDGRSDIFWRHQTSGANWMYNMEGASISASSPVPAVSDTQWKVAAIGDLDADGDADIFWRNQSTGANWVYLMEGTSISESRGIGNVSDPNWQVVGQGDFDANGTTDILWRHGNTGSISLFMMDGTTITESKHVHTISDLNWKIVGVDDLDSDGKSDIIWRHSLSGVNWIHLMDAHEIKVSQYLNTVTDQNWKIVNTADLDGNQKAEIIWHHASSGSIWAYFMDGASISASRMVGRVSDTNWQITKTGDFNGDGNGDILWRNSLNGQIWMFEMSGAVISLSKSVTVVHPNWELISK